MKTFLRALLAALAMGILMVVVTGCGLQGPLSSGNVINHTPPEVRGTPVLNLEASMFSFFFQPYDAAEIRVDGWFITPNDPGYNHRTIHFDQNVIRGVDTMNGKASFVIASYDWPQGWNGNALTPGVTYFFMITIHEDPSGGRIYNAVWQYKDGVVTQIS